MFFFIGGLEPRQIIIDEGPYRCPACDRPSARIVRVDQYISLFFIPVFPIKRGEPLLACEHCGYTESAEQARRRDHLSSRTERSAGTDLSATQGSPIRGGGSERCPSCGAPVKEGYNYCPKCGFKLR